jgi:hypothetical protein
MPSSSMQLSLLGREPPALRRDLASLKRIELDDVSWLEHVSGFVQGHAQLFEELRERVVFREERRTMYEREVDVPRLVASADVSVHPLLVEVAAWLKQRYAAQVEHIGLALYRHGQDSVA